MSAPVPKFRTVIHEADVPAGACGMMTAFGTALTAGMSYCIEPVEHSPGHVDGYCPGCGEYITRGAGRPAAWIADAPGSDGWEAFAGAAVDPAARLYCDRSPDHRHHATGEPGQPAPRARTSWPVR